jgi:hypothetical protein
MFADNIIASILGTIFLGVFVYIHLHRKDLNVLRNFYSYYALGGGRGYLVKISLVLIGINQVIISYNLLESGNISSAVFIYLSGIGAMLPGIFDVGSKNKAKKFLHDFGAFLYFFFLPLAIFFVSGSEPFGKYFRIIGLATFIISQFIFTSRTGLTREEAISQKVNIFVLNLWLIIAPLVL